MVSKRRSDLADERDLFVAQKTTTLDEHDTSMDLQRGGELHEVIDVRRDEHAIFLVCTLENVETARPENPRSRTWHASMPSAARATAAAGDRFSSSRSFTERNRVFLMDYAAAREGWLCGSTVTFPAGTYWLGQFAGVPVAAS
jgi:hypothetical protein